ncbi:putative WRKY transcription factor 38 [Hordeum vulgare]|nr:putative WRKY transcription factor 38 [Hordeum vulgare]
MTSNSMTVVHGGSEMDALLRRQQELVVQLRAIILPALCDADSRSADLAVDLFDGVIGCITPGSYPSSRVSLPQAVNQRPSSATLSPTAPARDKRRSP